jgi:hypothetical protein
VTDAPADRAALVPRRDAEIARVLKEPDLSRDDVLQLLDNNAPLAAA